MRAIETLLRKSSISMVSHHCRYTDCDGTSTFVAEILTTSMLPLNESTVRITAKASDANTSATEMLISNALLLNGTIPSIACQSI
jgi:hypothetical protein